MAPWEAPVMRSYDAVFAETSDDEPPQALEARRPSGLGLGRVLLLFVVNTRINKFVVVVAVVVLLFSFSPRNR